MVEWLFRTVFSKTVPFKWIDGHKTEIARVAAVLFALLLAIKESYPSFAPFISETTALLGTIFSLIGIEVGQYHKEIKSKEG